jgi:hypothetical protein
MQKTIFAEGINGGGIDTNEVKELVNNGWKIVLIVPQSVGISITYSASHYDIYGGMLFLLEKDDLII